MRLDEFETATAIHKTNMASFVAGLRQRHKVFQMGGSKRFYSIGNTGKVGIIFLLAGSEKALGVAWEKGKKTVASLYIWDVFDPDELPDVAIDVPADAAMDNLLDQLDKFIKNPKIGVMEATAPTNPSRPNSPFSRWHMPGDPKPDISEPQADEPLDSTEPTDAPEPDGEANAPTPEPTPSTSAPMKVVPAPKGDIDDLTKRLIKRGEVVLMGRHAEGEYFVIPGVEAKLRQLDKMLNRKVAEETGGKTMEEQYEELEEEVRMVASGNAKFTKSLIITGMPSAGKALALDTPLPSPDGWTTMGAVKIGDRLFDENGSICTVTGATEIQYDRECYAVRFDDGSTIVADREHRWLTNTDRSRRSARLATLRENKKLSGWVPKPNGSDQSHKREFPSVKNTGEIANSLVARGKWNHHIEISGSVEYSEKELPIDPLVLGYWLGDGIASGPTLTVGAQDIEETLEVLNARIRVSSTLTKKGIFLIRFQPRIEGRTNEFKNALVSLGLLNNKHIPREYLEASVTQRLDLLRGLMDTDGSVDKSGRCEFSSSDIILANNVLELVRSLGIKCQLRSSKAVLNGVEKKVRHRISFTTKLSVFGMRRKAERLLASANKSSGHFTIVGCDPVESVPVRCITVDSPSHLFLASNSFIPTHNTFRVMKVIKDLGLEPGEDYIVKKGRVTESAMYRTFIEQIDGLIVMDDCDSMWESTNSANMLKNVLDTTAVRSVNNDSSRTVNTAAMRPEAREAWLYAASRVLRGEPIPGDLERFLPELHKTQDHSDGAYEGYLADAQLKIMNRPPNQIDFSGRMIFISNLDRSQLDSAVLTRSNHIDLNFSDEEMLDFIETIGEQIEQTDMNNGARELTSQEIQEVFAFVRERLATHGFRSPINFRFFQKAYDARRSGDATWRNRVAKF